MASWVGVIGHLWIGWLDSLQQIVEMFYLYEILIHDAIKCPSTTNGSRPLNPDGAI